MDTETLKDLSGKALGKKHRHIRCQTLSTDSMLAVYVRGTGIREEV